MDLQIVWQAGTPHGDPRAPRTVQQPEAALHTREAGRVPEGPRHAAHPDDGQLRLGGAHQQALPG